MSKKRNVTSLTLTDEQIELLEDASRAYGLGGNRAALIRELVLPFLEHYRKGERLEWRPVYVLRTDLAPQKKKAKRPKPKGKR